MKKNSIEDAIIVATYEHEIKIPVETVDVELIQKRKVKRSRGLFSELFDVLDVFDLFFSDPAEEEYDYDTDPAPSQPAPDPEPAVIVATNEKRIDEIHFAYYEFVD